MKYRHWVDAAAERIRSQASSTYLGQGTYGDLALVIAEELCEAEERGQRKENDAWEEVCQKAIAEWEGHRTQASLIERNESAENYLRGAQDGVGGIRRERLKEVRERMEEKI